MFSANRWAAVFLSVTAGNAESAFSCLKLIVEPVKSAHIALSGYSDAVKLEKILRESVMAGGTNAPAASADLAAEYAIRYLCMLVRRKCFGKIDFLLEKIEQKINEQKGILSLTLETPSEPSAYEEELLDMIKEKTGAAGIKMKNITRPELLGGYILRMGSTYIDASLKGQIEIMKSELNKAALSGGINVQL